VTSLGEGGIHGANVDPDQTKVFACNKSCQAGANDSQPPGRACGRRHQQLFERQMEYEDLWGSLRAEVLLPLLFSQLSDASAAGSACLNGGTVRPHASACVSGCKPDALAGAADAGISHRQHLVTIPVGAAGTP